MPALLDYYRVSVITRTTRGKRSLQSPAWLGLMRGGHGSTLTVGLTTSPLQNTAKLQGDIDRRTTWWWCVVTFHLTKLYKLGLSFFKRMTFLFFFFFSRSQSNHSKIASSMSADPIHHLWQHIWVKSYAGGHGHFHKQVQQTSHNSRRKQFTHSHTLWFCLMCANSILAHQHRQSLRPHLRSHPSQTGRWIDAENNSRTPYWSINWFNL